MEFHAWIKQGLLQSWPDSVDASAHLKEKSIVKSLDGKRLWAKVKRSYAWLAFDIHRNRACLFCYVVLDWQESRAIRKKREARAKTPLYFSWIACLSFRPCICSNICAVCVYFMRFKKATERMPATSAVGTQQSHLYGAISYSWVSVSGSCTARHAHRGTSVTGSRYNHHHFLFIGALLESRGYGSTAQLMHTWCLSWLKYKHKKTVNRKCYSFS